MRRRWQWENWDEEEAVPRQEYVDQEVVGQRENWGEEDVAAQEYVAEEVVGQQQNWADAVQEVALVLGEEEEMEEAEED